MQTATVARRHKKSSESPQEALARIQQMEFGQNDVIVIQEFSKAGIRPEDIDPRHNVLTFRAWKAKGRRVARGAKSIAVVVWIPKSESKTEDDGKDGKKKRGGMYPKTTRLFHESQTVPADADKGTRPEAWANPTLVRKGTYEEPEPWTESTTIEQVESEMREVLTGQPATRQEFNGPTIGDIRPESETAGDCSCPMVGVMTNVDCPLHGGR
jgi:hypothetical protein